MLTVLLTDIDRTLAEGSDERVLRVRNVAFAAWQSRLHSFGRSVRVSINVTRVLYLIGPP